MHEQIDFNPPSFTMTCMIRDILNSLILASLCMLIAVVLLTLPFPHSQRAIAQTSDASDSSAYVAVEDVKVINGVNGVKVTGSIKSVTMEELKALLDSGKVRVIDVRDPILYAKGHIPQALNLPSKAGIPPSGEILTQLKESDGPIILYCGSQHCNDSTRMADQFVSLGIPANKIRVYKAGWIHWALNRGPIVRGASTGVSK